MDDYKKFFCKHCTVCGEPLIGKFYPCGDKFYHDKCFVCKDCGKSIVSGYKESPPGADHDVGVFCPDHYYEHFGDTCSACGKKIHSQVEMLRDFKYHPECFACCVCKKHLENGEFKVKFEEDGQPPKIYCETHYGELVAQKCFGCKKPLIGNYVTANRNSYHHECFKCETCGKPIEKSYAIVNDKVTCPDCKK